MGAAPYASQLSSTAGDRGTPMAVLDPTTHSRSYGRDGFQWGNTSVRSLVVDG